VNIARKIRQEGGLVTDGAVLTDGRRYVLRDYDDAYVYAGLPPGRLIATVPLPFQLQGEAITWSPDGRSLLIASERDKRLLRVTLPISALAVS
jgi:Tol biopolymer transport system component